MKRTHLAGLGAGFAIWLSSASAFSQTIVIDPGCGTTCPHTLQEAVIAANSGAGDRIEWAPDVAQTEAPSATLDIDRDITIVANGAFHPIVTWSLPAGQPLFRVGNTAAATLRLEHVVLVGDEGNPAEDNRAIEVTAQGRVELVAQSTVESFRTLGNGVIHNLGDLLIEDTQIFGNFSHGAGGAIYQESSRLVILRTSIYGNHARVHGGGIAFDGESASTLVYGEIFQSSLFGNQAGGQGLGQGTHPGWPLRFGVGGGIHVQSAHFMAENTTLSRNLAESEPQYPGVASNLFVNNANTGGATELRHVTLAEGGAPNVNGVFVRTSDMRINGSIIHAAIGAAPACDFGPMVTGDDVIRTDASCTIFGNNILTADPRLAPIALAETGPGTIYQPPYHPIGYFGPAVDAASCSVADDQRGVSRPQRAGCDIGAYELEPLDNGTSLEFDGSDDYVDMGDPIDMTGLSYMTVSFWMKVENNWQTLRYLISRLTPSQKQFAIQTASSGKLRVSIARDLVQHLTTDTVNQPITLNTWHQVAMVYDGTQPQPNQLRLYVDGVAQALTAPTCAQAPCLYPLYLTHPSGPSPLRLGASSGTPNWFFTGKLDEVAVFDGTAMSALDVADLYGSGSPDDLSGYGFALSHWWRFDGDTLPTIDDHGVGLGALGTMVQMEASDFSTDAP